MNFQSAAERMKPIGRIVNAMPQPKYPIQMYLGQLLIPQHGTDRPRDFVEHMNH
jgi:hypothetical protein